MNATTDMWRDLRHDRQAKRAKNRASSRDLLVAAGVSFEEKNDGAHFIVEGPHGRADFWPGTGLWQVRGSLKRQRGVKLLLVWLCARVVTGGRQ